MLKDIVNEINARAKSHEPFLFAINYTADQAIIKSLSDIDPVDCLYDFNGRTNCPAELPKNTDSPVWSVHNPDYSAYERSFNTVRGNILRGNSYLVNLTCQARVDCDLSLRDIFLCTEGKYRLYVRDRFTCFSPEPFIRITDGRIYSHPMKGTADALMPNSLHNLLADEKEAAEHATIVDLIRNDLSTVATNVRVDDYRYAETLQTNKGPILQTSSRISGTLREGFEQHMGDVLASQLPAGSITGAPKPKTLQIIAEAEGYDRGFYTGVMGICEGGELDSAVMIRFVEQSEDGLLFKAGGGITSRSVCRSEYDEVVRKMYLPLKR